MTCARGCSRLGLRRGGVTYQSIREYTLVRQSSSFTVRAGGVSEWVIRTFFKSHGSLCVRLKTFVSPVRSPRTGRPTVPIHASRRRSPPVVANRRSPSRDDVPLRPFRPGDVPQGGERTGLLCRVCRRRISSAF